MIFDGHGDIWTDVTCQMIDHGESDIFRKRHLKKFQKGNVTGGIFVIWIDPPYDKNPKERAQQIIECVKKEIQVADDIINIVKTFDDFGASSQAQGKIDVVMGMEGLSQIGEDIDLINYYYDQIHVRHAMLSWNETNLLATGWPGDKNRGLTYAGKEAVNRIQSLGMVMDVSHLNDKCFWDVMSQTQAPVIASHSNARAVCPAMRNLTDEMIVEIANTGGLLGMNSLREFIDLDPNKQNVARLADHAEYVAELVGTDYIGLGYDFDDYLGQEALSAFSSNTASPSGDGISNEAEAGNLLLELKKRGFTEDEIQKIAYKNFYRVFKECWKK